MFGFASFLVRTVRNGAVPGPARVLDPGVFEIGKIISAEKGHIDTPLANVSPVIDNRAQGLPPIKRERFLDRSQGPNGWFFSFSPAANRVSLRVVFYRRPHHLFMGYNNRQG